MIKLTDDLLGLEGLEVAYHPRTCFFVKIEIPEFETPSFLT